MRVLSVDLLSASVKYLCKRRSWVFCVFEWYSWGPCCDREVFREQGAGPGEKSAGSNEQGVVSRE